jgi:hypothetical protein
MSKLTPELDGLYTQRDALDEAGHAYYERALRAARQAALLAVAAREGPKRWYDAENDFHPRFERALAAYTALLAAVDELTRVADGRPSRDEERAAEAAAEEESVANMHPEDY